MKSLYWISVISDVDIITSAFAIVLLTVAFTLGLIGMFADDDEDRRKYKKPVCITFIVGLICLVFAIFCPSRNELYIIYGVGNTIDYIKEHPDAQQLPEKTVQVLNKMADDYINKEEK